MAIVKLYGQANKTLYQFANAKAIADGATFTSDTLDTGQSGKKTGKLYLSQSGASATATCTMTMNESPDAGTTWFPVTVTSNVQTGNGQLAAVTFTANLQHLQVKLADNTGGGGSTANAWISMDATATSELGPVT